MQWEAWRISTDHAVCVCVCVCVQRACTHVPGPFLFCGGHLCRELVHALVHFIEGVDLFIPELAEVDHSAQVAAQADRLGLEDILAWRERKSKDRNVGRGEGERENMC